MGLVFTLDLKLGNEGVSKILVILDIRYAFQYYRDKLKNNFKENSSFIAWFFLNNGTININISSKLLLAS